MGTHPDILRMETLGELSKNYRIERRCLMCGRLIYPGWEYFPLPQGDICDDWDCKREYGTKFIFTEVRVA
jgi:hypothetical protein